MCRARSTSNFTADRLVAALRVQREGGFSPYVAVLPYAGLASGFLTGKYRPGADPAGTPRPGFAAKYLDRGGEVVLAALDEVAADRGVPVAAVALAWLKRRPGVVAPLASARSVEQLRQLLPAIALELTAEEERTLTAASDHVVGRR